MPIRCFCGYLVAASVLLASFGCSYARYDGYPSQHLADERSLVFVSRVVPGLCTAGIDKLQIADEDGFTEIIRPSAYWFRIPPGEYTLCHTAWVVRDGCNVLRGSFFTHSCGYNTRINVGPNSRYIIVPIDDESVEFRLVQ